jgi:hypothetical protein
MKRPLIVERHSRLLSKILDTGGKDRPRRLVNNQSNLFRLGQLDRRSRAIRQLLPMVAQSCLFQSVRILETGSSQC